MKYGDTSQTTRSSQAAGLTWNSLSYMCFPRAIYMKYNTPYLGKKTMDGNPYWKARLFNDGLSVFLRILGIHRKSSNNPPIRMKIASITANTKSAGVGLVKYRVLRPSVYRKSFLWADWCWGVRENSKRRNILGKSSPRQPTTTKFTNISVPPSSHAHRT